jgi:hypothetical protein
VSLSRHERVAIAGLPCTSGWPEPINLAKGEISKEFVLPRSLVQTKSRRRPILEGSVHSERTVRELPQ